MKISKPTETDIERFRRLAPDRPDVIVKPMFGNLGAFVNGNMFMGLFGPDVGLRLDDAARAELAALGGGPFGPAERPMGSYLAIPEAWTADSIEAIAWVQRALDHVSALPPKVAKPRKAKGS